GDVAAAARLARRLGMGLVVIDLSRAGTGAGIDKRVPRGFRESNAMAFYAGGVATDEDLSYLADHGFSGAIVGTAFAKGAFR
ncbi:MAG: HisA/HisF-related TIM barrel protein, partial [Methanobacteriota archaeon]